MDIIIIVLVGIVIILAIVGIVFTYTSRKTREMPEINEIKFSVYTLNEKLKDLENELKGNFSTNRQENAQNAKDLRNDLVNQIQTFSKTMSEVITLASDGQKNLLEAFADQLKDGRKEQKENLATFKTDLDGSWKDFRERQRENFSTIAESQGLQAKASTDALSLMQTTIEKSIKSLQDGNEVKLEEMRKTVDEKLEKTLETRLAQSFTLVSERLETVHKGLGEMQQLAIGVGDLKKVLSNVRTRGVLGETQLANILEQILAPEQYEVNVITKKGSNNRVEFAIKIPQQNQENKILLMPIDSKFPIEDYYSLIAAYDRLDQAAIESTGRTLESSIRKSAKDIHEKYINPPDTSEIGLLFLPIEGLYAEVVRRPALLETLQREYQIIITGPTTLSAILNTISFGYKTMAMEQRSGEIKKVLSAVRTEFNTFSSVLKKAQERINSASDDIDALVGVRTRKIQAKLKSFDELPAQEVGEILSLDNDAEPKIEESDV